jgi:muramoyltetrapeptide carboxypeptidase LdcA involved in peptidoglycan recycling
VCESGIFFRKKIEVFLPDQPDKKITLQASGRYACPNGYKFPDIQLSREDAKKLFGYSDFSKYETAAAVVIQE